MPLFRRDDMRRELLAQLRAAPDGDRLYQADPRIEEAIERALLPSWNEAAGAVAGERSGVLTKLRNTLVAEWGFPEPCAEDVIQHAARLAGPEASAGAGFSAAASRRNLRCFRPSTLLRRSDPSRRFPLAPSTERD